MIRAKNIWSILIIVLMVSCKKENACFKSTGENVTELRKVDGFHKIHIEDKVDVVIRKDTSQIIEIKGGKNVISGIKTAVFDETLMIANENKCDWIRNYGKVVQVIVPCTLLDSIYFNSSGNTQIIDTLTENKIYVSCTSAGGSLTLKVNSTQLFVDLHTGTEDVTVEGRSNEAYIYSGDARGQLNAKDLLCDSVYINHNGSGDLYVNSQFKIDAFIQNIGTVKYRGSPFIVINSGKESQMIAIE